MTAIYAEWLDAYPIVSIEDPVAEEDWSGWQELTASVGDLVHPHYSVPVPDSALPVRRGLARLPARDAGLGRKLRHGAARAAIRAGLLPMARKHGGTEGAE